MYITSYFLKLNNCFKMTIIGLVTGAGGQDGSYLCELLLEKGYQVWGIVRNSSIPNVDRIKHLLKHPNLVLRYGDIMDHMYMHEVISEILSTNPNMTRFEVYNLAAQSHVQTSFEMPAYSMDVNSLGTLKLLDIIRKICPLDKTRFYQASTSELFGKVQEVPQKESTPFYPRSPYGVSKLYAYWIVKNYRESFGMYACNGVLFNHDSPNRGPNFLTRKVTTTLGKILRGEVDKLVVGNLDALRDIGYAKDYVEGMWRMLQQDEPDDFILASGEMHSVREFIEKAFGLRGFQIAWKGSGLKEVGYDKVTGRELIFIDPKFFRPAEVDQLLGDASKAKEKLGWQAKTTFDELIKLMVDHDCPTYTKFYQQYLDANLDDKDII